MLLFRYSLRVECRHFSDYLKVRGTPASGKTVLAQLLAQYISRNDPTMKVIWIDRWPLKDVKAIGGYRNYLQKMGWVKCEETVFIFDEAQLSYEDIDLWADFFRSMHAYEDRRAIVFASYGSPSSRISFEGIPMLLNDRQRVTLRPIHHEDDLPPVGLFFSREEFDDLVSKRYPSSSYYFHSSFFDAVFDLNGGHIGAICDFVTIIAGHQVVPPYVDGSDDILHLAPVLPSSQAVP
jgi:hypothetical protein